MSPVHSPCKCPVQNFPDNSCTCCPLKEVERNSPSLSVGCLNGFHVQPGRGKKSKVSAQEPDQYSLSPVISHVCNKHPR